MDVEKYCIRLKMCRKYQIKLTICRKLHFECQRTWKCRNQGGFATKPK